MSVFLLVAFAACSGDGNPDRSVVAQMRAHDAGLARVLAAIARNDRDAAIRGWHEVCPDEPDRDLLAMFVPRCAQLAVAMECGEMAFYGQPTIPEECRVFASGLKPGRTLLVPYPYRRDAGP